MVRLKRSFARCPDTYMLTAAAKSGLLNDLVDFPIQVTAAADVFPNRREPILPSRHARIRRSAMLYEDECGLREVLADGRVCPLLPLWRRLCGGQGRNRLV